MLPRDITPDHADAAFDILVEHARLCAGKRGLGKRIFVRVVTRPPHKYGFYTPPFSGRLVFIGDGGDGVPRVAPDGLVSADQLAVVEKVNVLLAALFAEERADA